MTATATAIAEWVAETPLIDGVLFGSSDGEVAGPPVCAVAVAGNLRGYGKGHNHSQALHSAVGEVMELVAAERCDGRRLIRASFGELAEHAFDPRWLGLYSAAQYECAGFPYRPFDEREILSWIEGWWVDTRDPVYLPAFAVYLSEQFESEALCQVTSNGLAAGFTLEEAVEHAALELYERDAFLVSWKALTAKRRVNAVDGGGIAAHLAEHGASVEYYLLCEAPAFVAVAVACGDGVLWPAFTLGLGAARNADDAFDKALLELGQTGPYLARVWRRAEVPVPRRPQEIKTLQDQGLYYCDAAQRATFERWRRVTGAEPCLVRDGDVRIAVADITPDGLRNGPYRVVRGLGRGLQNLECGYGFERLPCPRLLSLLAGRSGNKAPCPIC